MKASQSDLIARWKTGDGIARLKSVLDRITIDNGWATYLDGFPYADEVPYRSDLRGVDLSWHKIYGGQFGFASLDFAVFDHAVLEGSDFQLCSMRSVSMRHAKMDRCNLVQVHTENSFYDFSSICDSFAMNSLFSKSSFFRTNMSRTALSWATFDSCNLNECQFDGADLYQAVFNMCV